MLSQSSVFKFIASKAYRIVDGVVNLLLFMAHRIPFVEPLAEIDGVEPGCPNRVVVAPILTVSNVAVLSSSVKDFIAPPAPEMKKRSCQNAPVAKIMFP